MPRVADISLGSSDAASGRAKSIPTLFGQGVFAVAAVVAAVAFAWTNELFVMSR